MKPVTSPVAGSRINAVAATPTRSRGVPMLRTIAVNEDERGRTNG